MSDILSREQRIERAKLLAPKSTVQEREGLLLGHLVTVNADMMKLAEEDSAAQCARIAELETVHERDLRILADFEKRFQESDDALMVARAKVIELGEQLEFDRSTVADSMTAANKAIDGRHWLTEGRGPYEWDDDRWHSEFYAAAIEIKESIAPMTKIAQNWKDCPMAGDAVAQARIDIKAELAALRLRVQEGEADMKRLDWLEKNPEANEPFIVYHPPDGDIKWRVGPSFECDDLRLAIDAAMSAEDGK